jgi:tetratricopeptide (TPR) repeat protein
VNYRLNISAGEFFDLIWPAVLVFSALISAWVLASARKRFPFYQSLLWALGTLFFPLILLPLYFVALLVTKRKAMATPDHYPRGTIKRKWTFSLPLLYASIVLSCIGVYVYRDTRSVDAHLAQATMDKLKNQRTKTIQDYKAALALEDDPHTHKLLAIELAGAGYWTDAISEFRLAQKGGEPDDSIHFRLGALLDKLGHPGEARLEYQEFLNSPACTHEPMDVRCETAGQRILLEDRFSAGLQ